MKTTPPEDTTATTLARIRSVSASPNPATVDMLTRCLRMGSSDVRVAAIEKIAEIDNPAPADLLHPLLLDATINVRFAAAAALGSIGSTISHSHLIQALGDRNALVRMQAAESLGVLGARPAIKPLTALLDDSDELVRGYAADALGDIGHRGSIAALHARYALEGRNATRVRILSGLFKLGEKAVLPQILRFLNTRSYRVRCATVNTLDEIVEASTSVEILDALRVRMRKESTVAVKSTIEDCIASIKSRFATVEKP